MGMPAVLTVNGTSTSSIWTPDWMQTPFSIAAVGKHVGGATFQYNLEYTLDDLDNNALNAAAAFTAGNATWVSSITGFVNASTTPASGSFIAPVRGIRINASSATATSVFTVTLIQATYGR